VGVGAGIGWCEVSERHGERERVAVRAERLAQSGMRCVEWTFCTYVLPVFFFVCLVLLLCVLTF